MPPAPPPSEARKKPESARPADEEIRSGGSSTGTVSFPTGSADRGMGTKPSSISPSAWPPGRRASGLRRPVRDHRAGQPPLNHPKKGRVWAQPTLGRTGEEHARRPRERGGAPAADDVHLPGDGARARPGLTEDRARTEGRAPLTPSPRARTRTTTTRLPRRVTVSGKPAPPRRRSNAGPARWPPQASKTSGPRRRAGLPALGSASTAAHRAISTVALEGGWRSVLLGIGVGRRVVRR